MEPQQIHPADDNYQNLTIQLEYLTQALIKQTQSIHDAGETISESELLIENKLFRFTLSNMSYVKLLLEKTEYLKDDKTSKIKSIDLNLLVSAVRQQIESFSKIFYLFFDQVNQKEKEWRMLIFQLQGLRKQESFKSFTSQPNHPEVKRMIEKNDKELANVLNRIESHESFLAIEKTSDRRKILLGRSAVHKEISEILVDAGLHNRLFLLWSVYSNYAHNEYLSDRQYEAILQDKSNLYTILELLTKVLIMLTVRVITSMSDRFLSSKESFQAEVHTVKFLHLTWEDFISHIKKQKNN